jgi:hypothetical protein
LPYFKIFSDNHNLFKTNALLRHKKRKTGLQLSPKDNNGTVLEFVGMGHEKRDLVFTGFWTTLNS